MLYWRRWIILITVASAFTGILALRANVRMIRTEYVCENDVMHLDCEPPNVLEIHGADYGGEAAFICDNGQGSNQTCTLIDRTQKVRSACDNKPSCSLAAMTHIFGDPCPGLNKYLNVMYACVKPINATTPATTPASGISTVEGATTTKNTSMMNRTNIENTTQPPSTEPTQRTSKKKTLTTRPGEEGPKTQKVIPVFDPSNSVVLEYISNSAQAMRLNAVGFRSWVCIICVISVWWL